LVDALGCARITALPIVPATGAGSVCNGVHQVFIAALHGMGRAFVPEEAVLDASAASRLVLVLVLRRAHG